MHRSAISSPTPERARSTRPARYTTTWHIPRVTRERSPRPRACDAPHPRHRRAYAPARNVPAYHPSRATPPSPPPRAPALSHARIRGDSSARSNGSAREWRARTRRPLAHSRRATPPRDASSRSTAIASRVTYLMTRCSTTSGGDGARASLERDDSRRRFSSSAGARSRAAGRGTYRWFEGL